MARELEAMNLQLAQIVRNQARLLDAIIRVQADMKALENKIPAMLLNEAYRSEWTKAIKTHKMCLDVAARNDPPQSSLRDHTTLVYELWDGARSAAATIQTAPANVSGAASMIAAGQAIVAYVNALVVLGTFELALPLHVRWKESRAARFRNACMALCEAVDTLIAVRIPEAIVEQETLATRALARIRRDPWAPVYELMTRRAPNTIQTTVSVCFFAVQPAIATIVRVPVMYRSRPFSTRASERPSTMVLEEFELGEIPPAEVWLPHKRDVSWIRGGDLFTPSQSTCIRTDGAEIVPTEAVMVEQATRVAETFKLRQALNTISTALGSLRSTASRVDKRISLEHRS